MLSKSYFIIYAENKVWGKHYKVHDALPSLLVKFCEGSRVHGGLRLMKRCCRHCVASHEPDIKDGIFELGKYNDKLYMHIKKNVAPSYKTKTEKTNYQTECVFTFSDLICAKCNCKAGPMQSDVLPCSVSGNLGNQDKVYDKHCCIHNMVSIYSFVKELMLGLAEQLLVELNLRLKRSSSLTEAMNYRMTYSFYVPQQDTNQKSKL